MMADAIKSKETKSQMKSGKITIAISKMFCNIWKKCFSTKKREPQGGR